MKPKKKAIIIGGGMGPMASVDLHSKIIAETVARSDQEHPTVIHLSHSSEIPDRSEFLLGITNRNPAHTMFQVIESTVCVVPKLDLDTAVVGFPCNTFHAPPIWDEFMQRLDDTQLSNVQIVHMIKETAAYLKEVSPKANKIGVMSTTSTKKTRVYHNMLEPMGYNIIEVPEDVQEDLNSSFYNEEWGIKANSNPVTPKARNNFLGYVNNLKEQGAEVVILGCSEIPLALPEGYVDGIPLINPVTALARALIREVAPEKLRPLGIRA